MKKSIVVFGDLPIATKIVQFIEQMNNVELYVVIGNKNPHNNDPWEDVPILADYCKKNYLKVLDLKELENFSDDYFTIGVSCRFSKIISGTIIAKFHNGIINCHGGLNPEFQGVYSANHTILQNSPIGGGTIHYMDSGIDSGDIIRRCEFPVDKTDTAYSVFQKTQMVLEENLEEILPKALEGKLETVSIEELINQGHKKAYYNKQSLDGEKEINYKSMSAEEINRRIRAFDFPGYEPAYYFDELGDKVYVRYHY